MAWFFNEEWGKMRPWIDHILDEKHSGFRQDVFHTTLVLELVYFYERDEFDVLQYRKRAASRKVGAGLHRDLLRMVERISEAPILERKEKFEELAAFLIDRLKDPGAGPTDGFGVMYYWAKSRAKGISIIEAMARFPIEEGD